MRSLVYTSTQTREVTDIELAQILAVGREANHRVGVTGILAYTGGNCLGILEGDDDDVEARFEQIRADPRHTNVRVLLSERIVHRSFPDWSMAYQPLDPLMKHVPGFSDLFTARRTESHNGGSRARALLEWFRKHPLAPLTNQHAADDELPTTRVINGAITVIRDLGVTRFSVESVAARSGMSVAQIHDLFPTANALLAATVMRWTQAAWGPLLPLAMDKGAIPYLHAVLAAQAEEPALMRLMVSVLATATDPATDSATYYRSAYLQFREVIRQALTNDIAVGREPETTDPERGAQQLLALVDGLRQQALLARNLDLVEAFDRAAARLRRGWSEQYKRPDYWDIPVATNQ